VSNLPVHDLVFQWSGSVMTDQRSMVAAVVDGDLILSIQTSNGRQMLSITLGKTVPHVSGKNVTFALVEIWPGVLKLNSSILTEWLHAYITIVGCPAEGEL
jgi:hypothetical protein